MEFLIPIFIAVVLFVLLFFSASERNDENFLDGDEEHHAAGRANRMLSGTGSPAFFRERIGNSWKKRTPHSCFGFSVRKEKPLRCNG